MTPLIVHNLAVIASAIVWLFLALFVAAIVIIIHSEVSRDQD
jgi:hypothetical protein